MVQNLRSRLRGCLHYTGTTFAPDRVHSGSLSWLYIQLHDTTTKRHAGASHPSVISPLLLYRGENLSPVRNLATVSCIRETTTRFGVPIDWNWKRTRNVCDFESHVHFINMKCTFKQRDTEMTQSSCKRDTKLKSHFGMKLAPVRVFSCKHPLIQPTARSCRGLSWPRSFGLGLS